MKSNFYTLGVSSTKVNEYLSTGLPFVANEGIGDIEELAAVTNAGLVLPEKYSPEDEGLINAFLAKLEIIDRNIIRERARDLVDLEFAVRNYFKAYQEIIEGSSNGG